MQRYLFYILSALIMTFFIAQSIFFQQTLDIGSLLILATLIISTSLAFFSYNKANKQTFINFLSASIALIFTALTLSAFSSLATVITPTPSRFITTVRLISQIALLPITFFGWYESSLFILRYLTDLESPKLINTQAQFTLTVDPQLLSDARFINLAKSGLLENQIALPSFLDPSTLSTTDNLYKTLKLLTENNAIQYKSFSSAQAPYNIRKEILAFAKANNLKILTIDPQQLTHENSDSIHIIDLNIIAKQIQPLKDAGETIRIKVQRYGKEPYQGIGYLDDGSMVVVNGGGDYIGETVDTSVLSVKNTSAGRIIFTNLMEVPQV